MASKYARATGNWSAAATWSDTYGGAASSTAPASGDDVYIYDNYNITLISNATCKTLSHQGGVLSCGVYNLTINGSFFSSGTAARTINMGSGTWTVTLGTNDSFTLSNSNLTLNASSSLLVVNVTQPPSFNYFDTLSKTFNDVRINMGSSTNSATLNITGSPAFRLLDIRSANSAVHTVNLGGNITLDKFIALGSSVSNRLVFGTTASPQSIYFNQGGTCYGQYLDFDTEGSVDTGDVSVDPPYIPRYVGSNSLVIGSWLDQDPPKISTLIDPLTTAPGSSTKWVFPTLPTGNTIPTTTTVGAGGGGYIFNPSPDVWSLLRSSDTYDLVDSSIVFEVFNSSGATTRLRTLLYSISSTDGRPRSYESSETRSSAGSRYSVIRDGNVIVDSTISSAASVGRDFYKVEVSSAGTMKWYHYESGSFVLKSTYNIAADEMPLYRSRRIDIDGSGSNSIIGSVGLIPLSSTSNFFQLF